MSRVRNDFRAVGLLMHVIQLFKCGQLFSVLAGLA